ncbi:MAG: hypothetical protein EZS28_037137, partial [Streblomastix strix]
MELFDCLLILKAPANVPARKRHCMAQNDQYSSSLQEFGYSIYDEDRKTFLILAFMPRPEIEAFYQIKILSRQSSTLMTTSFMDKLDAHKLYMYCMHAVFEDITKRFPAMKNTFSKNQKQQKMTYAQMANIKDGHLRFFMEHGSSAWFIAIHKPRQQTALQPRHSAPPSSAASSIDDLDQEFQAQQKKKRKRIERYFLSLRVTLRVQGTVYITKHVQGGTSVEDTEFQTRIQANLADLDHREETGIIAGITTINIAIEIDSWRKQAKQNRWRLENLWYTQESAEKQPSESSQIYADCTRAVSFVEYTLKSDIHLIISEQQSSRFLIDAYLMCQTAGARVGIKHRASIDRPLLHMIMLRIMESATTTGKEGTGNRTIINESRIARGAQNSIVGELPSSKNYYSATSGGEQCDLNTSPIQSGRKTIELLAAIEIDRSERQHTERHCAYLERPRQCAQRRSPETQDRVQGRLRSTLELIQDYLVRAGRRRYNPGPGLFRKV